MNLAGVELSDLGRGRTLAAPGAFAVTSLVTVRVTLLPSAPRARSGDRFFFHHFSAEVRARLRVLEGTEIAPGGSARAQLRLSEPIAAAPGDRFVLRRLSPVETIGGGVVLDPAWPAIARLRPAEAERLDAPRVRRICRSAASSGSSRRGRRASERRISRPARESPGRRSARPWPARSRPGVSTRCADRRIAISPNRASSAWRRARASEIASYLSTAQASVGMPRRTLLGAHPARRRARDGPKPSSRRSRARGIFRLVGDEARPPGREDLGSAERGLSERILAVLPRAGARSAVAPRGDRAGRSTARKSSRA